LVEFSENRPLALVIPCLYSELEGEALNNILEELKHVRYLNEIIIGLDRADKEQFEHAKKFFSRLPQHHRILWNDGPRLRALDDLLVKEQIAPSQMGKGRNAWFCYGYFIASDRSEALALHDADIVTYNRSMLARLFYPVADPRFNYKFCKGFYYREAENQLKGRVTRLLVFPLIRSLEQFFGHVPFLRFLDGFRYPLAGEFSLRADVVKTIRIPSDWGLEIGLLSEVQRLNPINRICQVEVADKYDHKHQPLSQEDREKGLSKMSIDISKAIFRELAENGYVFSQETFRSLKAMYYKIALDYVEQYYNDAVMNGFSLDHHVEEQMVETFAQNIYLAGEYFLSNPMQADFIPSWKRVMSAIPDFMEQFYEAVEQDNKE
jgi:glucosyl-3-phosphoglycerate synthase